MLASYAQLSAAVAGEVRYQVALAEYTTWHVGGIADCVFWPQSVADLGKGLSVLPPDIPVLFLGLGSNVLIRDVGIRGVIVMTRYLNGLEHQETTGSIVAGAGVPCAKLARFLAGLELTGGGFLAGVPGTVGGALAMNAGAYGGETWDSVESVELVARSGEITCHLKSAFDISYREVTRPANHWFVSGTFKFSPALAQEKGKGHAEIRALLQQRSSTQPIGQFSGGSVFRNPPGDYAARLIESAGLKGFTVGGAHVSQKHANFIVSNKTATAADIEHLIEIVRGRVAEIHGVILQSEVHILG